MRIIRTDQVDLEGLSADEVLWIYNGLDNLITNEIYHTLKPQLDPKDTAITYEFELAMQGPAFDMMNRGFRLDHALRLARITEIEKRLDVLGGMKRVAKGAKWSVENEGAVIQRYAREIWGKPLNYKSQVQLKKIFYEDLKIPLHYQTIKGIKKVSTQRDTLERIALGFPRTRPFIKVLLKIRDLEKKLTVLNTTLDEDGRMRCSFQIAGTNTGRWSSSASAFKTGTNLQNIQESLRDIFVPDPGYTMFYADLKSAESLAVAYLSNDLEYIKACEEDDVHVYVARIVWPLLKWDTEDHFRVARELYYRDFSYRDLSKRGGHGTNYDGTPRTMGKHLHVEEKIMKRFQTLYYGGVLKKSDLYRWKFKDMAAQGEEKGNLIIFKGAFPGIKRWHGAVKNELQTTAQLTTPLGRKRQFWGRLRDGSTQRKAIAFVPQSTVGDILNIGLYRVWERLEIHGELQLMGQVHDAIVGQVPTDKVKTYTEQIKNCMEFDVPVNGKIMRIPVKINFGSNWKEISE